MEVDAETFMNNKALDVNLAATYYDKNNITSMLSNDVSSEQNGVGFYYIDKKRAANLLKCTGVQFPWILVANNFNGIIHQVVEKVNRKIDTILKSRQFIRWFGDRQNSPKTTTKEYLNGKDTNPQRLINNSRILYVDKKRANDWLSHNRLQLPLAYSSIGSDNIISRSDTDVKQKASEDSGSKYSIKVDMTEEERYNELKDKNLVVVDYNEDKLNSELKEKNIPTNLENLKSMNGREAEKPLKEIADALGIHGVNYSNSNIEFDFKFSKTSLNSSLHHQSNFEGTYADYAKMLSCLDGIIENAELVEIHPNYKGNKLLKQVYVLVSAFNDGNVIIPVQLEVEEQYDKNNGLYLNVVLRQIKKEPAVKKEIGDAKAYKDLPLVTGSTISLSQLFANVNTGDNKFLKYIPDKFLSEEQITAKRTAQEADYTKYGRYKEIFEGKPEQKFSLSDPLNRTYSYAELTAKPDMVINTVDKIKLPMGNGDIVRTDVVKMALKNVADTSNGWNKEGKVFLYNNDLGRNVKVSSKSIHHGLNRKSENNAIASIALPQYFSEAICINELAPRDYNNKSYVMLGMFNYNDTDYYVRMVVDERNNVCEIEDINVLYAINAKKDRLRIVAQGFCTPIPVIV